MQQQHTFSLRQKAIIALVAGTLVFSRQIGAYLVDSNRFFSMWGWRDSVAILVDICLVAIAGFAADRLLGRLGWPRLKRVFNHGFLLVIACSVVSLIPNRFLRPQPESPQYLLAWFGIVGLIGFSLGHARSRLVEFTGKACLLFSPIVVILGLQLFTKPFWDVRPEVFPRTTDTSPAATDKTPVLFFVFDEWSFKHAVTAAGFRDDLPNLKRLSEQAFDFRNAYSASSQTKISLPAIVYETDSKYVLSGNQLYWQTGDSRQPASEAPNLFRHMHEQGYRTLMHGFYLPYRRLLGPDIDYCRSWPGWPQSDRFPEALLLAGKRNLQFLNDPLTEKRRKNLQARDESRWWYNRNQKYLAEAVQLLHDCPDDVFCFFHWPLPHGPFVIKADGSYAGAYKSRTGLFPGLHGTPEDYERHLQYLDRVVGQLLDEMSSTGKLDRSLLIVTSDHGWRYDPTEDRSRWKTNPAFRHVPLLIKLPGQKTPHVIQTEVRNNHLRPLIDAGLAPGVTEAAFTAAIEQLGTP